MENTDYDNCASVYGVWDDVRRPCNHKLPGSRNTTAPSLHRVISEAFDSSHDSFGKATRCMRIVLLNKLNDGAKTPFSGGQPLNAQDVGLKVRRAPLCEQRHLRG